MEFLEGLLVLLEGVMGKGTANSRRGLFVGDVVDDRRGNGLGEVGLARIEMEEGSFGEEDASRRVSVEGFADVGSGGRFASGTLGTEGLPLFNYICYNNQSRCPKLT